MNELTLNDTIKSVLLTHLYDQGVLKRLKATDDLYLKGLSGSLLTAFIGLVNTQLNRPILICLSNRETAEALADELDSILPPGKAAFFPGGQEEKDSDQSECSVHRIGIVGL